MNKYIKMRKQRRWRFECESMGKPIRRQRIYIYNKVKIVDGKIFVEVGEKSAVGIRYRQIILAICMLRSKYIPYREGECFEN